MAIMNPTSHSCETSYQAPQLTNTPTACFRGLRIALHIIYAMLLAGVIPFLNKSTQQHIVQSWSRKFLDLLHVGLETYGCYPLATARGHLIVANHISWLDVVAMNAVLPTYFVAKSEVGDWPFLGWIFHRINTLFIKRDFRQETARINCQIKEILEQGDHITLFPEGTTSDGTQLGHFHSSLLQGPVDIGSTICPVAIRYHDGTGKTNGDAAFIHDMTFIESLWKIVCSPSLHVTLVYLPAIPCIEKNRRILASEAREAIHTTLVSLSSGHTCHTIE
ncbi:MAG: lyso-ornithine lipid acyltransferase [Candidatus Nitrotoga sp. SPKER]|nr:MAG: lyso-ornithine lipid acyltransferase [Candidatus Nitrotoga sp. SPKER]